MAAAKEWCMVALDCSSDMAAALARRGSLWNDALRAVQVLCIQKMLYSRRDGFGVIAFGHPRTQTHLWSEDDPEVYAHVYDVAPCEPASMLTVRAVGALPDTRENADARGCVLDALVLCVDALRKSKGYKPGAGRIVVVTCAAGGVRDAAWEAPVTEQMDALGVKMDVFGVDFPPDAAGGTKSRLLSRVCEARGGHLLALDAAMELLTSATHTHTHTRTPRTAASKFRGALDIANVVRIPVWSFGHTIEAKAPSMKRMPAHLAAAGEDTHTHTHTSGERDDDDGGGDGDGEPGVEASTSGFGVKYERRYRRVEGEAGGVGGGEEVDRTELVKAFKYGRDLVVVTPDDEAMMKWDHERELALLCFTSVDAIPRYCVMGAVDVVIAAPGDETAARALSSLATAMVNRERVAVVRYVKRKGTAPSLGVLVPAVSAPAASDSAFQREWVIRPSPVGIDCVYFLPLPFAEEIRPYKFNDFAVDPRYTPSREQTEAADAFIQALDLSAQRGPDGHVQDVLDPGNVPNPVIARFNAAVTTRALEPGAPLPALNPSIECNFRPNVGMWTRASSEVAAFQAAAGPALRRNPRTDLLGARRLFEERALAEAATSVLAGMKRPAADAPHDIDELEAHKPHEDGGAEPITAAGLFRPGTGEAGARVRVVSSATPIADFRAMLSRRDADMVVPAMLGLVRVAEALAADELAGDKARDCVAELRAGALANSEERRFNDMLRGMRSRHAGTAFWARIVNAGISLISREESPNIHDVTAADKHAFLSPAATPAAAAIVRTHEQDGSASAAFQLADIE